MKYPLTLLAFALITVSACGPRTVTPPVQRVAPQITAQNVTPSGIVESRFEYKNGKTELNLIIERSSGEELTLHTLQSPGSSSVKTQTTVRDSKDGQINARYGTLPGEAQLAVKLAANNGWRDVYRDLKNRYELAGLL